MLPFKSISTSLNELDRIQTNVSLFANGVIKIPLLDGILLEDIVLGITEVKIPHKLGRKYRGWILVNKNASQDIWVSSTTLDKSFLSLTAGGTVTASIWVF